MEATATQLQLTVEDQLVELSLPHIKHYKEDLLYHDMNWIRGNPGIRFLHFTRECGTDLVGLYPHDHVAWPKAGEKVPYLFGFASREHILEQTTEIVKYRAHYGSNKLTLYCNGSNVVEIRMHQAIELAQANKELVLSHWAKEHAERVARVVSR
jgi:hypothetical protein